MHRPKTYPKCLAPGCTQSGAYARGFCQLCYGQFRLACQRNGRWKDADERDHVQRLLTHPEIPPFEYENPEGEAELMEQTEREQQAKDLKVEETENE